MAELFVSYKRTRRDEVARIAERLQALGVTVWYDAGLIAGEQYRREIKRELNISKASLVCWTQECFDDADEGWVRWEAQYARNRGRLVPVFLDDAELEPPFHLDHTENLAGWIESGGDGRHDGWRRTLHALEERLERPGLIELQDALEPLNVQGALFSVTASANEAAAAAARLDGAARERVRKALLGWAERQASTGMSDRVRELAQAFVAPPEPAPMPPLPESLAPPPPALQAPSEPAPMAPPPESLAREAPAPVPAAQAPPKPVVEMRPPPRPIKPRPAKSRPARDERGKLLVRLSSLKPIEAAFYGLSLARAAPQLLISLAAIMLVFNIVLSLAVLRPPPESIGPEFEKYMVRTYASSGVSLLFSILVQTAMLRGLVRGEGVKGFLGLQFGWDELRVLFVTIVLGLVGLILCGIAAAAAYAAGIGAQSGGNQGLGIGVGVLVGIVGFLLLIWYIVRATPIAAATIARRRLAFGEGWRLSKNARWPTILAYLALIVPWLIISYGLLIGAMSVGFNPVPSAETWSPVPYIYMGVSTLLSVPFLACYFGVGAYVFVQRSTSEIGQD